MRTSLVVALGSVVLACGPKGGSGPTTEPPAAAATAARAPAVERVTVRGRLRAHDGTPLRAGTIVVRRHGEAKPIAEQSLAEDGSFRLEVAPGLHTIGISAVDHAQLVRIVMIDGPVEVDGTLGTYARPDFGKAMPLVGEFLDAAGKSKGGAQLSAQRVEDGVYRLDLAGKPVGAAKLRYQLRLGERTCNGPVADAYESDGGGDYWSVVDVGNRTELALDMRTLPPAGKDAALQWKGEHPDTLALRTVIEGWRRERARVIDSMPEKNGILQATAEHKAALQKIAEDARGQVDVEKDLRRRALLRAAHFATFVPDLTPEQARADLAAVVKETPVDDARLGLFPGLQNAFFHGMQDAEAEDLARAEAWMERVARENPEPGVAIEAIQFALGRAEVANDEARVAKLYALANEPRFRAQFTRELIVRQFDPQRPLQRGKVFPEFAFAALEDGEPKVTRAERLGRLYLVEFWATWCGPCVVEMPGIHETYAAINGARRGKGKNGLQRLRPVKDPAVEFVFVSFDATPADVVSFRKAQWSMPWTHAFAGGGAEGELMERMGFIGVPTAVLVDGEGKILEIGGALRGEQLRPTLERVLAETRAKK